MSNSKRVAFTFDERNYKTLEELTDKGGFTSLAETVRESIQTSRALQDQVEQGFSEFVVRNPKTGKERVVVIPSLSHFER